MSSVRSWRQPRAVDGPHRILPGDIAELNGVFSDAFTERYRRDGMVGVRVPHLNPSIWRYAIDDAEDGAMLWRGERDEIVAFNVVHLSGAEGWMGPLAVRPEAQGAGIGKDVVRAGVEWLRQRSARVIGLETMPRTMDNIGFYSALGFRPGRLTLTVTLDAAHADQAPVLLGRLNRAARDDALAECRALTGALVPGYDFTREIELTESLGLGDTVLHFAGGRLAGFALCHAAPLVEGRSREELRVLKLVVAEEGDVDAVSRQVADYARRSATRRAAIRVQGEYEDAYAMLIAAGGRVRWTDLRMTWPGHAERRPERGMVLSNWEI
ncbi:MAG: GNAT family N-acetyltransferase [Gemmatimonadaceae bacterium]